MNVAYVDGVGHRTFLHVHCAIAVHLYYLARYFIVIAPKCKMQFGRKQPFASDVASSGLGRKLASRQENGASAITLSLLDTCWNSGPNSSSNNLSQPYYSLVGGHLIIY